MTYRLDVRMSRSGHSPWGVRLHGGADFGTPLTIQKVNANSLGEMAGLRDGDVVLAINGQSSGGLRHKEAQELIVKSGNNFVLTVSRGGAPAGTTWQPNVAPVGEMPLKPAQPGRTFTKTSLAADQVRRHDYLSEALKVPYPATATSSFTSSSSSDPSPTLYFNQPRPAENPEWSLSGIFPKDDSHWDVKHNQVPKGFVAPGSKPANHNGTSSNASQPHIQGLQYYNSPHALYSDENIKEVLSQQTELLAGGVKGINIKQSEKEAAVPKDSEVLKALHELEGNQHGVAGMAPLQEDRPHQQAAGSVSGFRSIGAPVTKPRPGGQSPGPTLGTCVQCQRLVTGVFVKVAGRPMHADCFRCSVCSSSLKNVGHFTINDRLYCEAHARALKASQHQQHGTEPSNGIQPSARPQEGPLNGIQPYRSQHVLRKLREASPSPTRSSAVNDWSRILESDNAGAATNARDFTKQFMGQLAGGQETQQQQQSSSQLSSQTRSNFQTSRSSGQAFAPQSRDDQRPSSRGASSLAQTNHFTADFDKPKRDEIMAKKAVTTNRDSTSIPPTCNKCKIKIERGPFITALGRTWCPGHFTCAQVPCGRSLQEVGFVEEKGQLYCEDCYGKYLAPKCDKCRKTILGNCLKAMSKTFHPECFVCSYCGKIFSNSPFYMEDNLPYCEEDWNQLFTTKCVACGFPIEAGDRWVEALNNNYHSQCFNCTFCKTNLEGTGFFVKSGKPFCKTHAKIGF